MLKQKKTPAKNFFNNLKRKKIIETDRDKEFYNNTFQNFLNISNIKHYSRITEEGVVFPE